MGILLVQTNQLTTGVSVSPAQIAYNSNNVAGNLLLAMYRSSSLKTTGNISSTQGDIWSLVSSYNAGFGSVVSLFYSIARGGANTVSLTLSSETVYGMIAEYSGISSIPFDTKTTGLGTTTALSVGTITPATNSELLILVANTASAVTTLTPTDGSVVEAQSSSFLKYADKIISAAGSYTTTGTYGSAPTDWSGIYASFVGFQQGSSSWSPVDCRNYGSFPLTPVVVQGSNIYALNPNSDNASLPPTDSRIVKPTDSRISTIIPQNSRNAPPF